MAPTREVSKGELETTRDSLINLCNGALIANSMKNAVVLSAAIEILSDLLEAMKDLAWE